MGHSTRTIAPHHSSETKIILSAEDIIQYARATRERELQGRFVELRSWAVDVIKKFSGVDLDSTARHNLVKGEPISVSSPSGGFRSEMNVVPLPADGDVRISVLIGNGQTGTSTVRMDGNVLATGAVEDLRLGTAASLTGKTLDVRTTIIHVNPQSDRAAATYVIQTSNDTLKYQLEMASSSGAASSFTQIFRFTSASEP